MPMRNTLPVSAALITISLMSGCGSRGESEHHDMSVAIENVRSDVDAVQDQTDQAVASLERLQRTMSGTDLNPLFKNYSDAVARADSQEKNLKERAKDMAARKDDYIQAWDKQLNAVQDPDLKSQGQARADSVRETFEHALAGINQAQSQVDPLIDHLKQIQASLGYDLTAAGLEGIAKPVSNVKSAAADADDALGKARKDLHEASSSIGAANGQ
jgi:hypothetical protein